MTRSDLRGLRTLREDASGKFHRGVVLDTGGAVMPFGEQLHGVSRRARWPWEGRNLP